MKKQTVEQTAQTGWVACDYSQGDRLEDVSHSDFYATADEAREWNESWRDHCGPDAAYEGVRYVGTDGHLYVDEPIAD